MKATVLQGDVFALLPTLPLKSIDAVVSSPPYWKLRAYLPKDHPLKHLELGQERTPQEWVDNQVRVLALVRDVLADHGTVWWNIGDTYIGGGGGNYGNGKSVKSQGGQQLTNQLNRGKLGIEDLNLALVPQRLALALQDDGWIVRSQIIWHKPAPMPASVSGWRWMRCRVKVQPRGESPLVVEHGQPGGIDSRTDNAQWSDCPGCAKCEPHNGYVLRRGSWRPTSSWEPILMLAKTKNYYADGEAVKTPPALATVSRDQYTRILDDPDEQFAVRHDHETQATSGANLRDVWKADLEKLSKEELIELLLDQRDLPNMWTIASEPLAEKHYAAFPSELVHRCLKAATSARGYCPKCGMPWTRVIDNPPIPDELRNRDAKMGFHPTAVGGGQKIQEWRDANPPKTIGWRASCSCEAGEPRPGVVLDPFSGSGRTGLECRRLGLDFIGLELNPDYAAMGQRLLHNEAPLFS